MLLDYLHDYLLRIKPLYNVDQEMENVQKEFEQQWEAGTFPGWQVDIIMIGRINSHDDGYNLRNRV